AYTQEVLSGAFDPPGLRRGPHHFSSRWHSPRRQCATPHSCEYLLSRAPIAAAPPAAANITRRSTSDRNTEFGRSPQRRRPECACSRFRPCVRLVLCANYFCIGTTIKFHLS